MTSDHIKQEAAEFFCINADTFEIEVSDECSKDHFVLDDDYVDILHERLPRTHVSMISGKIVPNYPPLG
jgi:hypothetical protein